MMRRRAGLLVMLAVLAGATLGGGLVEAGVAPDSLLPRSTSSARTSDKPPAEAAREAQRRFGGGKVLNVEREDNGYLVKLLLDGDVRVVFIPNH